VNPTDLLDRTLEIVAERVGDPAPRVYQRLFERSPELQALFVLDTQGSARGEMFHRGLEALVELGSGLPHASGMVACEWSNHRMNGITLAQFNSFFEVTVEVIREALGADWTAEIDSAWQTALDRVQRITGEAAAAA
jgi:hemoglobin-like flavoprotein